MNIYLSTDNNKQDMVIAWTVALLVHVLFFSLTEKMFIKPPQFAIASSRAIEDSLPADSMKQVIDINLIDVPQEVVQVKEQPKPVIKQVEKIIPKEEKPIVKPIEEPKQIITSTGQVKVEAIPDYVQNPPPPYPVLAKQMHQEGIVILSVVVNKEGDPISVRIIQSSGYRMLDQAALKAVQHWKFQPGYLGNFPIESRVSVPIRFRLEK